MPRTLSGGALARHAGREGGTVEAEESPGLLGAGALIVRDVVQRGPAGLSTPGDSTGARGSGNEHATSGFKKGQELNPRHPRLTSPQRPPRGAPPKGNEGGNQ
eukprot:5206267-Alexandrium_andersonii.AAC.1